MKPSDEQFQLKLIDYLYGEMEESEKREFEKLLNSNPDLKAEADSLSNVRSILNEPQEQTTNEPANEATVTKLWYQSMPLQIAASIILVWVILLATAVMAGLQLKWDSEGFMVSFGETAVVEIPEIPETSNFVTTDLLMEYSELQGDLIARAIQTERENQARQLQQLFEEYATLIENRRLIDLQLIEMEIQEQRDQTDRKFRQAEFVLNELFQFVND